MPAATLAQYVALVKKRSERGLLRFRLGGQHPALSGVMAARAAGIEMTHVPYKGTAQVLQALAGGEIAAASTLAADIGALARAGGARILPPRARSAPPRSMPTFRESGYDIEGSGWYGLCARRHAAGFVARSAAAIDAMRRHRARPPGDLRRADRLGSRELAATT